MNKKMISVVAAIGLLTSSVALAVEDWTILGALNAKQTVARKFDLDKGKNTVEVYSTNKTKISCGFVLDAAGNVGLDQKNTTRCVYNLNVSYSLNAEMHVTNEENKDTEYRIWIHGQ